MNLKTQSNRRSFTSILPASIISLGLRQPPPNQFDFLGGSRDSYGRFFLKYMQNINRILETSCVHRPPSVPVVLSHNFHYAGAAESFKRLGRRISLALLRGE